MDDSTYQHQARALTSVRRARFQCDPAGSDAWHDLVRNCLRIELVVSTVHMQWATDRELANPTSALNAAVSAVDFGGNGWLLPVSNDQETACEALGFEDLARMLRFAREAGAETLRFDQAASPLPDAFGMVEYDWDAEAYRRTMEGAVAVPTGA